MSDPAVQDPPPFREAAYNGWGPKAWLVCAPVLTMLGGIFLGVPLAVTIGAAGFLVQGLWMVATDQGVASYADVTGRQAGVMLSALALAGLGYGITYLAQDERWMWLAAPAALPWIAFGVMMWRGDVWGLGYNRWLMLMAGVWVGAIFLYIAAGGMT